MNSTQSHQPLKVVSTAFGGLLTITLLSAAVLTNTRTYADTVTADDTVTITIESACTFAGDDEGTEHTKTIIPGTVESNIGTTRMTAICNDPAGFDIYAVGYTNNTWKNNTLSYTDSSSNEHTIATGTNTTGNSSWAMKLTGGNAASNNATIITTPTDYTNYAPVPGGEDSNYTKVATRSSNTTTSSDASLTSTYQVYANSAQVAGTYTGQVKYTLVHPQGVEAPEAKDPTICSTETCMQDLTSASIATLLPSVGSTATVYDARDEQAYTIAKLADNNYWMVSNMKLGKGNGEVITLTSSDSDLPSGTTFDLKATGMAWDGGNGPDATGDCNSGDWYPDFTEEYFDKSHFCINTENTDYGTYYNWYAATAGTGTYALEEGEAAGSICPKGWHLPPNEGNGSYYNLLFTAMGLSNNAASATAMQATPTPAFFLSGNSYGEGIDDQGGYGNYWSSTAIDSERAYELYFYRLYVNPQNGDGKGAGYSVRCVFGS